MPKTPETDARTTPGSGPLAGVTWRAGQVLDAFARFAVRHAPSLARAYGRLIAPGGPPLAPYPNWTFATEYYPELRWMAWRRAALSQAAQEHGLTLTLPVFWYEGTRVEVTLGNDQSMALFVAGSFEPNEFVFLRGLVGAGMAAIDVGANEGLYTLFLAGRVGREGRVIAVEPSSRERRKLHRNLELNGLRHVEVMDCALGAEAGRARLTIAASDHAGHNTLGAFAYEGVEAATVETVAVETLDAIVERLSLSRVDVVKIDVEGAEARVIAGAAETIRRFRPVFLIEANEAALRAQGTSCAALLATLRTEHGYDILVFTAATGRAEPLTDGEALSDNIVAVPPRSRGPAS